MPISDKKYLLFIKSLSTIVLVMVKLYQRQSADIDILLFIVFQQHEDVEYRGATDQRPWLQGPHVQEASSAQYRDLSYLWERGNGKGSSADIALTY